MFYSKQVIIAAVFALAVMNTPASPVDGIRTGKLGVGISVDSRWIAVEAYYSVDDRGATAREQAWAGDPAPRGATDSIAAGRDERVVRIATVPNVVGRTRDNVIAVRALTHAAEVIARHVVGAFFGAPISGVNDADRR